LNTLCRDCGAYETAAQRRERCAACGSLRLLCHSELCSLAVAHVDCDAFYASVEKRDRPELADRPVIIGGGARGVVLACCYVARLYGVRSAMPMFKALAACPDAVVIRPEMAKYHAVGREVRAEMQRLTPLVEPLSLADTLFHVASGLLEAEIDGATRFRLVGVGADNLFDSRDADPPTLFDRELDGPRRLEHAIDAIRGRLGEEAVRFGTRPPA
jgi:hypothetical protein